MSPAAAGKSQPRFTFGRIEDYKMLKVLGDGTYGVVQKARDLSTGKTVAIKSFRTGAGNLGRIVQEANFQAACRGDPSVVQIIDVVQDAKAKSNFLVMELAGGSGCLRSHIARGRGCGRSEEATRGMMRQLIGAAKRMHAAGVVHCDLKPENVLVGPRGELKICDFGLAMPAAPPAGEERKRMRSGTLVYSSPELLGESQYYGEAVDVEGGRYYGAAVDMWALGCVMAELLTGRTLFTIDDVFYEMHVLRYQMAELGTSAFAHMAPKLSEAGREVLAGLLAFDPEKRLTAAAALEHRWFREEEKRPGFKQCSCFPWFQ